MEDNKKMKLELARLNDRIKMFQVTHLSSSPAVHCTVRLALSNITALDSRHPLVNPVLKWWVLNKCPPSPPLINFSIFFPPPGSLIRLPVYKFFKLDNDLQVKAKTILHACARTFLARNFPPKIVLHNMRVLSSHVIPTLLN